MADKRIGTPEKFWAKVRKTRGCWLWTGAKDRQGYGTVRRRALMYYQVRAHRYAWIIYRGEIPEGKIVCHKCDTPLCVRPSHLFLGTHTDNMRDMWRKGRGKPGHVPGSKQGQSKLTEKQVIQIRALAELGHTHQEIADIYDVCRSNISIIVRRKGWVHV